MPGTNSLNGYANERYEAIVMDATTAVPGIDRVTGGAIRFPGSAGEISAHEILGHQLSLINNSIFGSSLNSIQAENLHLPSQGVTGQYRNSHVGLPFNPEKAEEIPEYLKP